jgi:transposase
MNYIPIEDKWTKRIPVIKALLLDGKTVLAVAKMYDVSSTYIKKLINLYQLFGHDEVYGKTVLVKRRKEESERVAQLKYGSREERAGGEFYKAKRWRFVQKQSKIKLRGQEFTIQYGEIDWPEYCPVLGIKLDYFAKARKPQDNSPSFDRVDNTKGYVTGNVKIISNKANRIKGHGSLDELKKIIAYIEKNNLV